MLRLRTTGQFKRDVRRVQRRRKDLQKLREIVERLLSEEPLHARNRAHRLTGGMAGLWECHIEPDWLLIWDQIDDVLLLMRTGTHTDLFD